MEKELDSEINEVAKLYLSPKEKGLSLEEIRFVLEEMPHYIRREAKS